MLSVVSVKNPTRTSFQKTRWVTEIRLFWLVNASSFRKSSRSFSQQMNQERSWSGDKIEKRSSSLGIFIWVNNALILRTLPEVVVFLSVYLLDFWYTDGTQGHPHLQEPVRVLLVLPFLFLYRRYNEISFSSAWMSPRRPVDLHDGEGSEATDRQGESTCRRSPHPSHQNKTTIISKAISPTVSNTSVWLTGERGGAGSGATPIHPGKVEKRIQKFSVKNIQKLMKGWLMNSYKYINVRLSTEL